MSDLDPGPQPSPTTNVRPDGTVFPPVTPDPPEPPGYVSPLERSPALDDLARTIRDGIDPDAADPG